MDNPYRNVLVTGQNAPALDRFNIPMIYNVQTLVRQTPPACCKLRQLIAREYRPTARSLNVAQCRPTHQAAYIKPCHAGRRALQMARTYTGRQVHALQQSNNKLCGRPPQYAPPGGTCSGMLAISDSGTVCPLCYPAFLLRLCFSWLLCVWLTCQ